MASAYNDEYGLARKPLRPGSLIITRCAAATADTGAVQQLGGSGKSRGPWSQQQLMQSLCCFVFCGSDRTARAVRCAEVALCECFKAKRACRAIC